MDSDNDATHLEGTAASLVAPANPDDEVVEVQHGFTTFCVTQKAKTLMTLAIDANANQPTPFYKWLLTIQAVADILNVDLMQHSAPQGQDELLAF